jgi:hypothetical protein
MRLAHVVGVMVVLSSLWAGAQTGKPGVSSFGVGVVEQTKEAQGSSLCPLTMHVRQGAGGKMTAVGKDGLRVKMFAARLKLLLEDPRTDKPSQRMAQATVTVHGMNGAGNVIPVEGRSGRADITKTLTVRLGLDEDRAVAGDLWLPGFTVATMVDLESVTYEDGTVWKFAAAEGCHTSPDFLMPVGGL